MEDIRKIHYDAWKRSKNNMDITVKELSTKDGWIGQCKDRFGFVRYGNTHIEVVSAMITALDIRGYEVGNIPEVMGIE